MDLYADTILDHYRHPRGNGRLPAPTVTQTVENSACGDAITIDLLIEGGNIVDLAWEGTGCAISQAGMSMLSEVIKGMSIADVLAIDQTQMTELLGVPIGLRRLECALLGLRAVKDAVTQWSEGKRPA